jgi:uncharacterized protein (TIGR03084 family)
MDASDVITDLAAESAEVDALVADLPAADWAKPTPAAGWTIAHQVAHLAWTDQAALMATTDPDAFTAHLTEAMNSPGSFVDRAAEDVLRRLRSRTNKNSMEEPAALLSEWRSGRTALAEALLAVPSGSKVLWYGTAMSPASMATARIMETWAHGLDIADALGATREPTDRLRHIVHLGHRTLGFSFLAHGRDVPTQPVRLELLAPDGGTWTYGPEDAANRVTGPALDFCYLVTQRRHRSDLALRAEGPVADEWLDIAQAFAGPPGSGREPSGAQP